MTAFLRRFWYLLNRRRFDRELAADLEFHREMQRENQGVPLGSTLRLREEARDMWGWTWIDRLRQDLRYAVRGMRRSPGFAAASVLILGLGIGCNVTVFGFFNLVMLQPLHVQSPESLLRFHRRSPHQYSFTVPYPEAKFFADHSRTLRSVIGVNDTGVSIEGGARPANASFVTANFFSELGGRCSLGRPLDPERDDAAGAEPVLVLSYGFWQRNFAGNASVIGKSLRINGKTATIAGVAERNFRGVGSGANEPAFWAPITQQPYFVAGSQLLTDVSVDSPGVMLWGRLKKGQTARAAEEELRGLADVLRQQYPESIWKEERLPSEPGGYLSSMMNGSSRGTGAEQRAPVYPVFALAGTLTLLILIVACSNLGGMLVARATTRRREMSIRLAIGASNARLVRQLFTESLLLAVSGSAAGLLLGTLLLRIVLMATDAPDWLYPVADWRITAFALGTGGVASILFGLLPALRIGYRHRRTQALRRILIATQVASSCILLIVAVLLARAVSHLSSESPGFDYKSVVSVSPGLTRSGYSAAQAERYLGTLRDRMLNVPGVRSVALAQSPPLGHFTVTVTLDIDGKHLNFQMNQVDAAFFDTMRIPLLRGRAPKPNEGHVLVVSEWFARLAWPGENALGKTLRLGDGFVIVGIAGNTRNVKFAESDSAQIYAPIEDRSKPSLSLLIRTDGSLREVARAAVDAGRTLDPAVFPAVELLRDAYENNLRDARLSVVAVNVLALLAQVLACFGIVSVVAYAVSQRTKEIGIRMALGAQPGHVLSVVLQQLSLPVAAGLLVGLAGAAAFSQFLRGRLYGTSNLDGPAYLAAIGIFTLTAALAAVLPAGRALRIDPRRVLHHD